MIEAHDDCLTLHHPADIHDFAQTVARMPHSVVERRSPFDFRGTPTGQTVNETKFQLEIGWKQAGTDRVYWKTTSQGSTSRSTNAATVSDQSIHQEMVDRLKRQLNSLMIPYYIPEDETIPLLPVISSR